MGQASPAHRVLEMYPRTTAYAHEVFRVADREATESDCEYLSDEHVLAGIVLTGGYASAILAASGADPADVLPQLRSGDGATRDEAQGTAPRLKLLVEYARAEVRHLQHSHLDVGHLLLAILDMPSCGSARMLKSFGVDFGDIRRQVMESMQTSTFPFGDALLMFQDDSHVHELCLRICEQDGDMKKSLHKHDFDAARRYREQKGQSFELLDRQLEKLWKEQRLDSDQAE